MAESITGRVGKKEDTGVSEAPEEGVWQVRGRGAQMRLEQEPGQCMQDLGFRKGLGLHPQNNEQPWRLLKRKSHIGKAFYLPG